MEMMMKIVTYHVAVFLLCAVLWSAGLAIIRGAIYPIPKDVGSIINIVFGSVLAQGLLISARLRLNV
jgi:hypothetical protein